MSSLSRTRRWFREKYKTSKIGDIRLMSNGIKRQVFTGKTWAYLCSGDPNCRIQARFTCRKHRNVSNDMLLDVPTPTNEIQVLSTGDIEISPNGTRRLWRRKRWHQLCQEDNCLIRAKRFCKEHRTKRIQLLNTNRTLSNQAENDQHEHAELKDMSSQSIEDNNLRQLRNNKRRRIDDNIFDTIAVTPSRGCELQTRTGRRIRCNEFMWEHLCADKKNCSSTRLNQQRHGMSIDETYQNKSNQTASLLTDSTDSIENSKNRKATDDINSKSHTVFKRNSSRRQQTDSSKSITSNLDIKSSATDIRAQENIIEETILNESDIELSSKSCRLDVYRPSMEIAIQPPSPSDYDSPTSTIVEQFGTIIKKETKEEEEEESLICTSSAHTKRIESSCETLQDFLRLEEMKKREFTLDCQRISYRLAKIEDCIGSISSKNS
ncbi:unnamed protein product [Rotaria magnacalcarata]|uniref:Uncharacterized protein n=3 Tax=Rotaria magnacalcarata TaxID=392030 RepID=A0A816LEQ2_9BILA|nr:unnamed protein product [Rotaria magnacalcarata]